MFNILKEKIKDVSTEGLTLKLTEAMIESLIKIKSGDKDIKVEIESQYLKLHGTTVVKKMMIKKKISYRILLKPVQIQNRVLKFELVEMKPVDIDMINLKIFNYPPFSEYSNRVICIDLNAWDLVKKFPILKIKSYELVDGAINLKLIL